MNKLTVLFVFLIFVALSCSKPDNSQEDIAPTNLTIKATVSTDSSGSVSFVATATNAVMYTYDYGDGSNEITVTGSVMHHYTTSGLYTVSVVAKSASSKTASTTTLITVAVVQGLVWADEFDTPGPPSSTKWGYDTGAGGWGNNEAEYYTTRTDNSVVSDGTLKIILKKESYQGSSYTSARMLTKGKFSFKYGRIEVRAKLPAGGGTWPAIWMLGDNLSTVGWPACGEIDIMEHLGNQLNKIYGTLHYTGHSGGSAEGGSTMITDATTDFHVYKCEWNSSTIKFFVDNALYYTHGNTSSLPFNQNFFIILNVAMGGNFGGTIDQAFVSAAMEIDYVRVYQ
jgi:beta-glucanase (GH16 family)